VLIADYGAFVEIEPGVEGLIHVSEMSWSPRLHSAQEFLKVGDEVEAQILTLDRENRKMSLGLKQLTVNPWENIHDKYPVGSQHKAIVRNITNFGVFAELEDGVEGLIHISDLSWNKIKHPSELVNVGDSIDVQILDFDEANHKLSLGHKQLLPNPWDEIEAKFPAGTVLEGTVASVSDKGATVTLDGDVEAFAFTRDLAKEDGKQAIVGEKLPFKVVELRRSTRRVLVSHVAT
jgi:small subunit ribosomal protein S1